MTMFDETFGSDRPLDEGRLRAEVEALDAQRMNPLEARYTFYWRAGIGLLFRIGQPWAAWAIVAILVADVVQAVTIHSWAIAIAALVPLIALGIYIDVHVERWAVAFNARLDARIRDLLDAAKHDAP